MIISASLLAANHANLGHDAKAAILAGANRLHLDIMDNHFVANLSFGPSTCLALSNMALKVPLDVHLMTQPVDSLILPFVKAGAHSISFHPEATNDPIHTLSLIQSQKVTPGIVINPESSLKYIKSLAKHYKMVTVMAVNPGFGGQAYLASTTKRVKEIASMIQDDVLLAVDGGITPLHSHLLAKAGANCLICGSSLFKNYELKQNITRLRNFQP